MLVKVKDWLELNGRKLDFRLQEPFLTLSNGKKRMEEKLGSLEPINCGLQKVKAEVLEKVIPIWSGIRELNPPLRLGKPAYYRCTNPAQRWVRTRWSGWRDSNP